MGADQHGLRVTFWEVQMAEVLVYYPFRKNAWFGKSVTFTLNEAKHTIHYVSENYSEHEIVTEFQKAAPDPKNKIYIAGHCARGEAKLYSEGGEEFLSPGDLAGRVSKYMKADKTKATIKILACAAGAEDEAEAEAEADYDIETMDEAQLNAVVKKQQFEKPTGWAEMTLAKKKDWFIDKVVQDYRFETPTGWAKMTFAQKTDWLSKLAEADSDVVGTDVPKGFVSFAQSFWNILYNRYHFTSCTCQAYTKNVMWHIFTQTLGKQVLGVKKPDTLHRWFVNEEGVRTRAKGCRINLVAKPMADV